MAVVATAIQRDVRWGPSSRWTRVTTLVSPAASAHLGVTCDEARWTSAEASWRGSLARTAKSSAAISTRVATALGALRTYGIHRSNWSMEAKGSITRSCRSWR